MTANDATNDFTPSASTALVVRAADDRVDAFLTRVAGLSPEAWGRLDARGAKLRPDDPLARFSRASYLSRLVRGVPRELAVPVTFFFDLIGDIVSLVTGKERDATKRPEPLPTHADPDARRLHERWVALWEIAAAQPGGPGDALRLLKPALTGLVLRGLFSARALERIWEPVEGEIPLNSL